VSLSPLNLQVFVIKSLCSVLSLRNLRTIKCTKNVPKKYRKMTNCIVNQYPKWSTLGPRWVHAIATLLVLARSFAFVGWPMVAKFTSTILEVHTCCTSTKILRCHGLLEYDSQAV
jgi:hypothetical protein